MRRSQSDEGQSPLCNDTDGGHKSAVRKEQDMKRTPYSVMVSWGMNNFNGTWRRVYEDDKHLRYIRTKNGYECIEDKKELLDSIVMD